MEKNSTKRKYESGTLMDVVHQQLSPYEAEDQKSRKKSHFSPVSAQSGVEDQEQTRSDSVEEATQEPWVAACSIRKFHRQQAMPSLSSHDLWHTTQPLHFSGYQDAAHHSIDVNCFKNPNSHGNNMGDIVQNFFGQQARPPPLPPPFQTVLQIHEKVNHSNTFNSSSNSNFPQMSQNLGEIGSSHIYAHHSTDANCLKNPDSHYQNFLGQQATPRPFRTISQTEQVPWVPGHEKVTHSNTVNSFSNSNFPQMSQNLDTIGSSHIYAHHSTDANCLKNPDSHYQNFLGQQAMPPPPFQTMLQTEQVPCVPGHENVNHSITVNSSSNSNFPQMSRNLGTTGSTQSCFKQPALPLHIQQLDPTVEGHRQFNEVMEYIEKAAAYRGISIDDYLDEILSNI